MGLTFAVVLTGSACAQDKPTGTMVLTLQDSNGLPVDGEFTYVNEADQIPSALDFGVRFLWRANT